MRKYLLALAMVLATSGFALGQGLTVWTHFGDAELAWLQNEAAAFESAFGVQVELVPVNLDEIKQRMLLAAPQGEAADLVVPVPHDQIGEMAAGGVLADMTRFATSDYLADLGEQARLAYTFGGRLFGLPMYVEGPALIVNTDIVGTVPATFEDMISTAQDLTDVGTDEYGFLYDIGNFYFSYIWINSMGGYVFGRTADGSLTATDVGLDNEGAVAGAQIIRNFRHDWGLIPEGVDYGVADGLFLDGAVAMIYNGPWAIPSYRDAGLNVRVVPVPPMADGTEFGGFMGVQGILMNQFSTNQGDAANFAKWITRPAAQVQLAEMTGKIPSSQQAAAQVADDPIIAGFAAALANAVPMPNIPEMGNVWAPMGDALTVIVNEPGTSIEDILTRAAAQVRGE